MEVLLLNASYIPLAVCSWKRAMTLKLKGKIDVIKENGRLINGTHRVPSVIKLKRFITVPYSKIPLTKNNVLHRDGYQCQYCGNKNNLTIDHITPKSKGGKHSWNNVVTACQKCNSIKENKNLNQTNLKLTSVPKEPVNILEYKIIRKLKSKKIKDDWRIYFGQE